MCGIIGQINKNFKIDEQLFIRMRDTLVHRGPDNGGCKLLNNGRLALGHRRLSIIDLSEDGNQPLHNEDKTVWAIVNGEIYNYPLLRNLLEKKGHVFLSNSDSEVVIHGYEEWGENLPMYLKGMFAFAIWDEKTRDLFLARDRFGIKPLYYYKDKDKFIFSSEIKGIVKNNSISVSIDHQAIYDFFIYRFIPSPRSIWNEVKKIPPAHWLKFSNNRDIKICKYWTLNSEKKKIKSKLLIEKFDHLLENAIKEHLLSDVPIGTFLSGGYDSSALVYYLNRLGYSTNSFALGFKDWDKSEHEHARIVADLYKTNHHESIITYDTIDYTEELSYYYDEPIGGFSFIPTYLISKYASQNNKVVLSGDGGDELLAGYNWYYNISKKWDKQRLAKKFFINKKDFLIQNYSEQMAWSGFNNLSVNQLLGGNVMPKIEKDDLYLYKKKFRNTGFVKNLQLLDIDTFLPELILTKVDRASMANSLEVRVPFLDHELFEFIFQFSEINYYKPPCTKRILHEIIKKELPKKIIDKPKKGFGMPYNAKQNFKKMKEVLLNAKSVENEIIDSKTLFELIRSKNYNKLWAIYIFENWYRTWNN